jgi:hypothetical protein
MKTLKSIALAGTLAVACMELLGVMAYAQTSPSDCKLVEQCVSGANIPCGMANFTNLVISENYKGTIQIGTNIYTRKDFADLAVIPKGNFGIWRADIEANAPKTNWLGSVITGERLGGGKPNGLLDTKASDEQIGLRSDGVVVWKKRE